MATMHDEDTGPAAMPAWRRESAFVVPRSGRWAWLGDPHAVAALLAALPAWAGLAAVAGRHMEAPSSPAAWLALVVLHPVVEELVFRGLLQGQLLRLTRAARLGGVTIANLLATMTFVAAHLAVQPPAWAIAVAAPSLVLGHLRERFGSVLPVIAMHAYYNAGFACIAWWLRHGAS